jgi:hypothetical protein
VAVAEDQWDGAQVSQIMLFQRAMDYAPSFGKSIGAEKKKNQIYRLQQIAKSGFARCS